jgi:hypothetical protein
MVIIIHIAVVGAGFIINRILYKLKARYARPIERKVIGRACITQCNRTGPQVIEGLKPLVENRLNSRVVLREYSPYPARAIIQIKID